MKTFQKALFNLILWATPLPARLGWWLACAGDFILERSGWAGMSALQGLARLETESEGR